MFKKILNYLGFDIDKFFQLIRYSFRYIGEYKKFTKRMSKSLHNNWKIKLYPILNEYNSPAGTFGSIYFFQDLWAAKKIFTHKTEVHYDIGSRIDGFIAHLLVFTRVVLIDIRYLNSNIDNLKFIQSDATLLENIETNSIESLSSLHAIEHFGLGRYGDPIDPDACFKAMESLQRVLKPGGKLYFSVPIGKEKIEFNAQRIFNPETILNTFNKLNLISFSVITDSGEFIENSNPSLYQNLVNGCGMFEFSKDS